MQIRIPFIYLAKTLQPQKTTFSIIAVRDYVIATINDVNETDFPIALIAKDKAYRWHEEKLWAPDLYMEGHNVIAPETNQIITETQDIYRELHPLPNPNHPFDNLWRFDNEQFINKHPDVDSYPENPEKLSDTVVKTHHPAAIWIDNNRDDVIERIQDTLSSRINHNGILYRTANEPKYVIIHEHDKTAVVIECTHPAHIPSNLYFNANEKEQAAESACNLAKSEKVEWPDEEITVLIPEAIKTKYHETLTN